MRKAIVAAAIILLVCAVAFLMKDRRAVEAPGDSAANYEQAHQLYKQGRWSEAIPWFDKAIAARPDFAAAYRYRGDCHFNANNIDKAVSDYKQAIRYNDQQGLAYVGLGNSYYQMKRYQESADSYTEALKFSRDASTWFNRGQAYKALDKLDLALADFTEAIKLGAMDPRYYRVRGTVHMRLGKLDLALADFNEAVKRDPDDAITYRERGSLYTRMGKLDLAKKDIAQARKLEATAAKQSPSRPSFHSQGDPTALPEPVKTPEK